MKKKRTTVSLNEPIHNAGLELMAEDAFDDFSEWLENLIRAKWREKYGLAPFPGIELRESPEPAAPAPVPAKPVTYPKPQRSARTGTSSGKGTPRKSRSFGKG